MISLAEAENLIADSIQPLAARSFPLNDALNLTLAASPVARLTQPQWPQVAMDGYALNLQTHPQGPWPVQEQLAATGDARHQLRDGHALQVTTGAPLPAGADTVVIQENVTIADARLQLNEAAERGANIRPTGQDFHAGDPVGSAGDILTPGAIAAMHHAGVSEISATPHPRLGVVITGSELHRGAHAPADGQTPDTNGPFLRAWARQQQLACELHHCDENPAALQALVTSLHPRTDVIVVCGGASVGPRDGSHAGLAAAGADCVFSKVAQKPGKPMALYRLGDTPILLLPGNPAAVFCGAYWHLLPVIRRLQGRHSLQKYRFQIRGKLPRVGGRSLLLRAHAQIDAQGQLCAAVLDGQLSHLLGNLTRCNALLQLDPGVSDPASLPGILLGIPNHSRAS